MCTYDVGIGRCAAVREEFRRRIVAEAEGVAKLYLYGKQIDQPATREQKEFIEGIVATDYDGRTLVELLQNGHDAHTADRSDGRLEFLLREDEGAWGVLYVANGGRPVGHDDFTAMCHVAMSNKRPDEGIGNKGVGFKSVLQLADSPEIYSRADSESPVFDGYCFRFAQPDDFDVLAARVAPDLAGLGAELRENVASLKVPVPVDDYPDEVSSFSSEVFATVVRLVLRSAEARERVRRQLNELTSSQVPFHLFLDRVAEMTVTRVGVDGDVRRTVCTRHTTPRFAGDGVAIDDVVLQGSQRFLMLRMAVEEDAVKAAIARSRSEGRLGRAWDRWRGDAQVCVALPVGTPLAQGRLYTFLPMGEEAQAPLAGFVNAPFFARLDRRSLETKIPLNDLLLDRAAVLCARVALLAVAGKVDVPRDVLMDIVAWQPSQLPRLTKAFEELDEDVKDLAFIPALGEDHPRTTLRRGWLWQSKGRRFTAEAVSGAGISDIIDPNLHPHRLRRLTGLAADNHRSLDPSDERLAAWAEAYALRLGSESFGPQAWADFYDDLPLTMSRGASLAGRRIIVDEREDVIAAGTGKDGTLTVFLSPQSGDGDAVPALRPPPGIAARLAFTHPAIPWRTLDPTRRTRPGRAWLEQHDLLREYRTDAVLDVVGTAMQAADSKDEAFLRACLIFAFQVWHRTSRDGAAQAVARAGLLVPTSQGWTAAQFALFGRGWAGPQKELDDLLVRFFARGAAASRSLHDLAGRVIPGPAAISQDEAVDVDALRVFLEHAGVQHGLTPIWLRRALFRMTGKQVGDPATAPHFAIQANADFQRRWREFATQWPRLPPQYPTVEYAPATDVASLPGQFDYHAFDRDTRRLYAELILHGLDHWPDTALEFQYTRASYRTVAWPTPLAAFLGTADWLPQTTPGQRTDVEFRPPAQAWWLQTADTPAYLPAQPASLRNLATARVLERLRKIGIRYWDDPATAAHRLVELTDLVASRTLGAYRQQSLGIRKAYETAWRDLIESRQPAPIHDRLEIIAARTGRLLVVPIDDDAETVYVADKSGIVQEQLLQQAPILMFPIRDRGLAERIHHLLKTAGASRLRSTSDAEVKITVDDTPAETAPHTPLLSTVGSWLTTLVLAVMEFHSRTFPPTTAAQLTQAAHHLDAATVTIAERISTSVDGHPVDDPRPSRSFLLNTSDQPRIIIAGAGRTSPWHTLQAASPAIAELVGMPTTADTLRLALVDLQQRCGDSIAPTPADIAVVLGVGTDDVTALMAERTSWLSDRSHLIPVLACLNVDLAEELRGTHDQIDSPQTLRAWLTPRLLRHDLTADTVIDLADRGDLHGAVRVLNIDLADANAGLRAMALPPVHNRDGHSRQFAGYLQQHRQALQDRIRDAFLPAYRSGQPLHDYLRLRQLPGLKPDETWLDQYWDLPRHILAEHVERWLHDHVPDGPDETAPLPIDATRDANRRSLSRILSNVRPIVEAWLHRHAAGHGQRPADFTHIADMMTQAGALDFERLTQSTVVAWLRANRQWPDQMPPTANQTELGLTDQDLTGARHDLDEKKEQQRRAQTFIRLDDKTYSSEPADIIALADTVRSTISPHLLNTSAEPSRLADIGPAPTANSTPGGDRQRWTAAAVTTPPETLRLIGLTGEIVAGEWLRQQYGIPPEESWVSGYRNDLLGDNRGDDSLGYDFKIVTSDRVRLLEVKATVGEHPEFTLGETEVRRAQNLAPDEEYIILFVTHVLDTNQRRITVLPNPLDHGGLNHYHVIGRAIRLQFNPIQDPPTATR